jgi:dTDP-4-dehydrorhamnose reductase
MTRWLVTGAGGLLGQDLLALLRREGEQANGLSRAGLDVTDAAAVREVFRRLRPDVIVNCAAWTAVDAAEAAEEQALAVNGRGPANLAGACAATGGRLFQLSTDYVYGGTARRPYPEDAIPDPGTAYGRTKLAGERAVLGRLPGTGYVVRTAWLYGAQRPNFVRTMIRLERERPGVDVADDQHGQPTWTVDVASRIVALARSPAPPGVYHATSSGQVTWCGLAREVFRLLGADPARVRAVGGGTLGRPAPRPAYTVLGHARWAAADIAPIPDWRQSLGRAFPALAAAETGAIQMPGAAPGGPD